MKLLAFDIEYHPGKKAILEYGLCDQNRNTKQGTNVPDLLEKIQAADVLIGHNILHHDLKVLGNLYQFKPSHTLIIDTIFVYSMYKCSIRSFQISISK